MSKPFRYLLIIFASSLFLLVIFLRFYSLGSTPQGLTQDEAYYLYDAYSIHETGSDIWGQHLPLVFKSTGEYKLNLPYLIAPAIDLVGLNTTAVRLPSAVFGALTLIVVAFIVFEFTSSRAISIISSFALALSPWHFGISRLFYEANVGIFFLLTAFLFSLRIVRGRRHLINYIALAAFSAVSAYLYGPYRYLGLGLIIITLILSWKNINKIKLRNILVSFAIYFLALTPLLLQLDTTQSLTRLAQETKLHQFGYELTINEARMNCYLKMDYNADYTKICYAFWNKPLLFIEQAGRTATRLLSPEYLFFTSADNYIVSTNYGAYSSYFLPFYLLGIYTLIVRSISRKEYLLLTLSLLSSLAVTSIIGEVVYHRNVYGLALVFVVITIGISQAVSLLKKFKHKHLVLPTTILVFTFAIFQQVKFITHYYTTHTIQNPLLFKYDAPEVFEFLADYQDYTIYDNIFYGPIYAGIYWELDPTDFQQNAIWADPDDWGFSNAQKWQDIRLTELSLSKILCLKHHRPNISMNTLVIDDPGKYNPVAALLTHDFSGSLTLHAIYDIDLLYPFVLENYPGDLCQLE